MRTNHDSGLMAMRWLVRYVDEERAIIDIAMQWAKRLPAGERVRPGARQLLLEMRGSDGSLDEQRATLHADKCEQTFRFEVVRPQRWWPAGMGEQSLYDLTASLLDDRQQIMEQRTQTIGLTSVRTSDGRQGSTLLVNGQECEIRTVVPVDLIHHRRLLPAAGHSLLLVRDHYGPDVLYQAADRAGILLMQCVPVHPEADPEYDMDAHVTRLAGHPSLVGWFVGHHGRIADKLADLIKRMDPTHQVFRMLPIAA